MISSSLFFVVFRFYFRRFPRIFFEIPSAFFRNFFFFFVFFWGALFRYRSIRAFVALFRYRSIRAFIALFRYRSIRAFVALLPAAIRAFVALLPAAIRALGALLPAAIRALGARGCTSFTPGCILAPFQGAHSHHKISHICRRQMSTPHRHLWRGGGRQAGAEVTFPSQNRQRPQRGRLFPLANYLTSAVSRCLHPIAIYGEGVADRPGLRSGGQGVRSKINGQGLRSKTRGMN